ncbi:conserved hypothetical protein [Planktothrix sp. PCC 11201]|uniref:hypothetical protein n=1 Tax=Planktothrix sp. PCC 11201 TaxID=1729650 RepID=UPI000914BA72|nr:hypothetical protein [Planktothrix sp. PCC 11201]SKB14725.1 conserved hypothetical protein [Planktothrix sp. PCC 11201]
MIDLPDQVEDYLHKASRLIVGYLVFHQIRNLIIGKNLERICRGLYQSSTEKRFGADVNGSLNIISSSVPKAFS